MRSLKALFVLTIPIMLVACGSAAMSQLEAAVMFAMLHEVAGDRTVYVHLESEGTVGSVSPLDLPGELKSQLIEWCKSSCPIAIAQEPPIGQGWTYGGEYSMSWQFQPNQPPEFKSRVLFDMSFQAFDDTEPT